MWIFIVAVSWLVFEESNSSAKVGIITFSGMVPALVISPIGGLMGDAFDRRRLSLVTFIVSASIVVMLVSLSVTGVLVFWHIAVIAFFLGIVRHIREPAMQALIPNQVPKEDLLNALVLSGATRHGSRFLGLLVASPLLLVDYVGINGVLILSAVFHVLGAVQMHRTRTVSSGEMRSDKGFFRNLADGMIYIYTSHTIALFILLVAFHCALVMSFESILPVFSRDQLGAIDGSIFGYLVMGFGLGSLGGLAIIAGVKTEKRQGQFLMVTSVLSGIAPMFLSVSGTVLIAVIFAVVMGIFQASFMALTNMYVQLMAPDRLRARISSLYVFHAGGIMAFANLGYGFMADVFSAPPILLLTGALFVLVVVNLAIGQPILRRVFLTGHVGAA